MNPFVETILFLLAVTPVLVLAIAWGLYCTPVGMRRVAEPFLLLVAAIVFGGVVAAGTVFRLPVAEIAITLVAGWWNVLERAVPRVEVNPAGVATGVLCIALTIFLMHLLAAWLYAEVRSKHQHIAWPTAWRSSWTVCLVAVVMLMFVAGLVGVGLFRTTSWLVETSEFVQRRPGFR